MASSSGQRMQEEANTMIAVVADHLIFAEYFTNHKIIYAM